MIDIARRFKAEFHPAISYDDAQSQAGTVSMICAAELAALKGSDSVDSTVCGPTYFPSKGLSPAVGWLVTVTLKHDPGSISATIVLMGMLPSDRRFRLAASYALSAARRMRP